MNAGLTRTVLDALLPADTYRDIADRLRSAGWTPCGAGDWAFALSAPDGDVVARISPFDPVGPYTAQLYREAAHTSRVPQLHAHRRLAGGSDLLVMERLHAVPEAEASAFHDRLAVSEPEFGELATIVARVRGRGNRVSKTTFASGSAVPTNASLLADSLWAMPSRHARPRRNRTTLQEK